MIGVLGYAIDSFYLLPAYVLAALQSASYFERRSTEHFCGRWRMIWYRCYSLGFFPELLLYNCWLLCRV
jgi:hypothetical protein